MNDKLLNWKYVETSKRDVISLLYKKHETR
jgi:hypothetical protein